MKGLSRTQLVMAATGKEGDAAKTEAKRFATAGEVIEYLTEQSGDVATLLNPDNNRRYHICEFKQVDKQQWDLFAGLLVENDWPIKDTKAAVS